MLKLDRIHHVAIICSDYNRSKKFYTGILGFSIVREIFRADRDSWKLDLALNNNYCIELFSFPETPPRLTRPEACGLRHLAFVVNDIEQTIDQLKEKSIFFEPLRTDTHTNKKFTFIFDPDGLPIELYEM